MANPHNAPQNMQQIPNIVPQYPAQGYPPTQGYPPQGYPTQGYPAPGPGYPQQGYVPLPGAAPYPNAPVVYNSIGGVPIKQAMPTVYPKVPYGPSEEEFDATALRKAMKGLGTDETAIIAILANRSNHQRQLIARKFDSLFGKDLVSTLKSELSGKFEDVIVACMMPLEQYYAKELHSAMVGLGTNEHTLIEILCSVNNAQMQAIKTCYLEKYKKTLESDVKSDTSGCFERLLIALCKGTRDENPVVNPTAVASDVEALYKAGQKKLGTDEPVFIEILTSRSLPHLREVFRSYQKMYKIFEKVVDSDFSGSAKTCLLVLVRCITNCPAYFAEKLHTSLTGKRVFDKDLIRMIVTRSENDLGDIKIAFQQKYIKSLKSFVEDRCSGDYKKMLAKLVNEN